MDKLFLCLFILLSSLSSYSQTQNIDAKLDSLVQRVDSLEHELSYLKLSYELASLNSDVTMFANEVDTKAIAIQLDLYNRNFDSRLASAYRRYYESCENKMQSFSELIEAKKTFFAVKVFTYPYSESELKTLLASYNVINNAYETLQRSMELLDLTIKEYRKYS